MLHLARTSAVLYPKDRLGRKESDQVLSRHYYVEDEHWLMPSLKSMN
jgi:hypothetical protein